MLRAIRFILLSWSLVSGLLCRTACAEIPAHELAAIRQAANQITMRATPQKPRTVLIWNTPPALMDKDPHKGYCIPFTGHPWTEEVGVTNEDPQHPLVAAFGGTDFRIMDEIYEYGPPFDRARLRVLLSLDPARTNMGVRWINRRDNDFALAWVKPYGEGRVFNTSFGHMASLYSNPQMLQFYLDAIQFATGDLSAPTESRTERPARNVPGTQPAQGLEPGFLSLFDGQTLSGWQGDPQIWSVRDGAITGRTTADTKLTENNFLIWKDEVEDFELRLKFRLESGNSGIYFRARKRTANKSQADPLIGMQADFDDSGRWTGVIMEYLHREVLAERGQIVTINEAGQKQIVPAPLKDPAQLVSRVTRGDWNDYRIRAQKERITLWINGEMMCELNDQDPRRIPRGWLALQVHVGPPMVVQFKDIALLRL